MFTEFGLCLVKKEFFKTKLRRGGRSSTIFSIVADRLHHDTKLGLYQPAAGEATAFGLTTFNNEKFQIF